MSPALLIHLTRRDLTDRFSGSALGGLWAFIQPLVMVFIFTVIFSQIMSARLPGSGSPFAYGMYLMSGMLPWVAFSNTCLRCANLFSERKAMIQQGRIALASLPLVVVASECFTFFVTTTIMLAIMASTDGLPGWPLVAVIPVLIAQQILAYGLGLLLATFTVFLADLREMASIFFQLLFWFTPIVYFTSVVPAAVQPLVMANPASIFVESYHAIYVTHTWPDLIPVAITAGIGVAVTGLALWVLRRLERDVRDFI